MDSLLLTSLGSVPGDGNRDYNRDPRRLLKRAEKSNRFVGKIEGVSSLPVVYLSCIVLLLQDTIVSTSSGPDF